jgi:hypothetical protein
MTATLTPTTAVPTTKASWLPRLVPGVLRLHRTALISVAVIYLAFTAIAFMVVHQVGHPRAVILAGQVFNGTLYSVATYAFYLPILVAVFIGAPMFARPLETGTFRFAWTQGVGRRRLVATTLMVFVFELTVLSFALGIVLSRLWFDLSPQFPSVWAHHVFFTNPWMMTFSSVIGLLIGVLLGVVSRRVLTALATTTLMMIAIYLWATMWFFYQETLLWFAKRMPSSYLGVPLKNGNYLAHYDYASVNLYFTDRFGHVLSYPMLSPSQKLALNQDTAPELHRLGLQEWHGSLFHQQFHGFLMMWLGFGIVTVIALVVAIFAFIGGNDRLLLRRGRKGPVVTPLVAIALTGLFTSACSTSNSVSAGLTPQRTHAMAISEERHLSLPAGASWPTIVFQKGVVYQAGNGQNRVDQIWFCDWSKSLLSDSPSSFAFTVALSRIEVMRLTYMYRVDMDSGSKSNINHLVASAQLGDTGPLASYVQVNC